jgi:hypothetical protein
VHLGILDVVHLGILDVVHLGILDVVHLGILDVAVQRLYDNLKIIIHRKIDKTTLSTKLIGSARVNYLTRSLWYHQ